MFGQTKHFISDRELPQHGQWFEAQHNQLLAKYKHALWEQQVTLALSRSQMSKTESCSLTDWYRFSAYAEIYILVFFYFSSRAFERNWMELQNSECTRRTKVKLRLRNVCAD